MRTSFYNILHGKIENSKTMVIVRLKLNKSLQAYYTNSDFITEYMISKLNLTEKDSLLEPCVGEGVFIDKIIKLFPDLDISLYDIDEYSINIVQKKYNEYKNIKIHHGDTLLDFDLDQRVKSQAGFTKIIGNPPYGATLNHEQRNEIACKYKDIYFKDTYVLFFYLCLRLLNKDGKLVFIIPDSFLYLNRHLKFRKYLFANYCINEILIFNSKLFPGVSFGYCNLCIITITNNKESINSNVIKIYDNITKNEDFLNIDKFTPVLIDQREVLEKKNVNIHLNQELYSHLSGFNNSLGDIAYCVTGIYTGNNKKYIKVISNTLRNSKGYSVIKDEDIDYLAADLKGIEGSKHWVPIVKGSIKIPYFPQSDNWYIDWSRQAVLHYQEDKKARFQNSTFYFKEGIAISMLKSKKINAALMEGKVFDQSIVGIFPKDKNDLYFLLALLNSSIVNDIIHNINPTVNNSANYMKRIPVPSCSLEQKKYIERLVKGILNDNEDNYKELDEIFNCLYKLDQMN